MRVVDYKQTKSKQEAVAFIEATKDNSIYEVVVRGDKSSVKDTRNIDVYIDDELAYLLRPAEAKYWNRKIGEFYLSKTEGWQLCKYLECYAEGGVTPCWWAQAEKNIRRHGDPMLDLRTEFSISSNISIRFLE